MMPVQNAEFFPWSNDFTTGIAILDEQHQTLIALINQLASYFTSEKNDALLQEVLNELSDYTVYHFQYEEKLWASILPEDDLTKGHQADHHHFIASIQSFHQHTDSDSDSMHELLAFLTRWLSFHILDADRYMASIVLHVQEGMSLQEAKETAKACVHDARRQLTATILRMYDDLSAKNLLLIREIRRRKHAEEYASISQQAIDHSLESIFITNHEGIITDANPAFCSDVAQDKDSLIGKHIREVKPMLFATSGKQAWQHAKTHGSWMGDITQKNESQGYTWLSLSAISNRQQVHHYVGVISSASILLRRTHQLEDEAHHDALTQLPNRRLFLNLLKHAFLNSQRHQTLLAVCFIDLDGFKAVNDSLGHDAGDILLQQAAQRMNQSIRNNDIIARMGGDEFTILLETLNEKDDAMCVMEKTLQAIQEPFVIAGQTIHISASIGISFHPNSATSYEALLKEADHAMYAAKHAGKARIHTHP